MDKKLTTINIYSPSAIVNIFQNCFNISEEKKLIGLRGIYNQRGTHNYNGSWYDELKDESSDNLITLIVPDRIRNRITHNKTIEIICYITKKAEKNGTIVLQATITDLLMQTQNKYSEEEIKAIEIQQRKSNQGFRDLDSFIKKCIYDGKKPVIKILYGRSAIIDEDIKIQMAESIALYNVSFVGIKLNSISDILTQLNLLNNNQTDIVVISRGGEDVEVLNKPQLAEFCLSLKPFFVTAIGHAKVVPLLEKIADKKFITPTALGQYLKEIYNNTVSDFEQSKAKLADNIKKQLSANFEKQISNMSQQLNAEKEANLSLLANKEVLYNQEVASLKNQLISNQSQFDAQMREKERLLMEKENLLNSRIEALNSEKEERNKIFDQSKNVTEEYRKSIDLLQNKVAGMQSAFTKRIVAATVVAIIIGVIIGLLI